MGGSVRVWCQWQKSVGAGSVTGRRYGLDAIIALAIS
jgi:hypothetical protein